MRFLFLRAQGSWDPEGWLSSNPSCNHAFLDPRMIVPNYELVCPHNFLFLVLAFCIFGLDLECSWVQKSRIHFAHLSILLQRTKSNSTVQMSFICDQCSHSACCLSYCDHFGQRQLLCKIQNSSSSTSNSFTQLTCRTWAREFGRRRRHLASRRESRTSRDIRAPRLKMLLLATLK